MDPFVDLGRDLPRFQPTVILDVGANVGQSAARFRAAYPLAEIFCFEPVQATYLSLRDAVAGDPRIHCHHVALGSQQGTATLVLDGTSDRSRIEPGLPTDTTSETVPVDTLSNFCTQKEIPQISYLKIDTEGHDLEVLRGGESLLAEARVDVLEVEAGMSPDNHLHVPISELVTYLEGFGYRLFALYEQVPEWQTGRPQLRRTNPVFISPELARAGTQA